jgi:hypothetical protein
MILTRFAHARFLDAMFHPSRTCPPDVLTYAKVGEKGGLRSSRVHFMPVV